MKETLEKLQEFFATKGPGVSVPPVVVSDYVDAMMTRLKETEKRLAKIEAAFPVVNAVTEDNLDLSDSISDASPECPRCGASRQDKSGIDPHEHEDLSSEPMGQDMKDAAEGADAEAEEYDPWFELAARTAAELGIGFAKADRVHEEQGCAAGNVNIIKRAIEKAVEQANRCCGHLITDMYVLRKERDALKNEATTLRVTLARVNGDLAVMASENKALRSELGAKEAEDEKAKNLNVLLLEHNAQLGADLIKMTNERNALRGETGDRLNTKQEGDA